MKTNPDRLQQRIAERLGPGPGPEEFVIEEIAPRIYAWHLIADGEIRSPLQAPLPWRAYAKQAMDLLKVPGSGGGSSKRGGRR